MFNKEYEHGYQKDLFESPDAQEVQVTSICFACLSPYGLGELTASGVASFCECFGVHCLMRIRDEASISRIQI